jgi:hypothetical protein
MDQTSAWAEQRTVGVSQRICTNSVICSCKLRNMLRGSSCTHTLLRVVDYTASRPRRPQWGPSPFHEPFSLSVRTVRLHRTILWLSSHLKAATNDKRICRENFKGEGHAQSTSGVWVTFAIELIPFRGTQLLSYTFLGKVGRHITSRGGYTHTVFSASLHLRKTDLWPLTPVALLANRVIHKVVMAIKTEH